MKNNNEIKLSEVFKARNKNVMVDETLFDCLIGYSNMTIINDMPYELYVFEGFYYIKHNTNGKTFKLTHDYKSQIEIKDSYLSGRVEKDVLTLKAQKKNSHCIIIK